MSILASNNLELGVHAFLEGRQVVLGGEFVPIDGREALHERHRRLVSKLLDQFFVQLQALRPTTATVDNWLASSSLTLTAPQTAAQSTSTYSAVTASSNHSCGLRTNGTITCWGTWAFRTA